jgi:hypothetical protein
MAKRLLENYTPTKTNCNYLIRPATYHGGTFFYKNLSYIINRALYMQYCKEYKNPKVHKALAVFAKP